MSAPTFWRAPGQPDLLFCRGVQESYAAEPRGEYIVGLISGNGFRAERGRQRVTFRAGDLGVWDPSDRHAGVADAGPWECRMLVLEPGALDRLAGSSPEFPDPVVHDPPLAAAFARMHRAAGRAGNNLERDALLVDVVAALVARSPGSASRVATGDAVRAVRLAREHLRDNLSRNVTLAELAGAVGMSEYALVRAFRRTMRVPPHRYQLGLRLAFARRLLERGIGAGEVAARTGFHDQSHLHRHLVRNFGLTPGAYARTYKTVPPGEP